MIPAGLVGVLIVATLALGTGTGVRWWLLHRSRQQTGRDSQTAQAALQRWHTLRSWWLLLAVFAAGLIAGRPGLAVVFGVACLIGLAEFHRIFARTLTSPSRLQLWLAAVAVGHYSLMIFFPPPSGMLGTTAALLLVIVVHELAVANTHSYLRTVGGHVWAGLVLIVGLSSGVALTDLPVSAHAWNAGVVGWTLFAVLLTECSDIAQALVGRRYGRHKITPRVSPGKSWEGLLAGMAVAAILAWLLAPPLTNLREGRSAAEGLVVCLSAGVLLTLAGFIGDVNISALKREAGLKDSGNLFPGMGGMLDRLDSLTFTTPALYCYALSWNER